MSLKQFLRQLKAQNVKWRLVGWGAIRSKCHECPITVFHGQLAGEWNHVGKQLGLSRAQRLRIVNAADKNAHPRLRAKLLKACGLA